ncbi:50S ribosomal protein L18e [Candidatus Micrarchaeota archaeon]|nr:50S ribosomal protein L18e [Candidatus Micrarchaeota archaeon]
MKKENQHIVDVINRLRKEKKPVWLRTAELLERPRRKKVEVNLSKINRYAKEGIIVVVPGKVLGDGNLDKKITIAAFSFSGRAKKTISECGGKVMSIEELVEQKIEPKNVVLVC